MTTVTPTEAPAIRTLRAEQLVVDRTVQRALDTTRAARIAADFDRSALGTFVVSHRADGSYHIIDGQHRHAVVILLDGDKWELNCEVHENLTRAEEARMFRLLNNSRPVGVLDKFVVRVEEQDPIAVGITQKLNEHGWTVVTSKAVGSFVAVGAIEKAYRRAGERGPALADWVLGVVTESFGHNVDGVRGEIITGLSLLWLRHGEQVDRVKLVNELQGYVGGPRALVGRARSLKEYRGGTVGDAMAEHLVSLINKNRRVHRLPAWDTED